MDAPPGLCPRCELAGAVELAVHRGLGMVPAEAGASPPSRHKVRYFGDYELLEEIARGGMGIVYKARQVSLNRLVAVKMILSGHLASSKEVKRFQAEARVAASLQHPNIVPIHEVGEHEGQHYFSMDFVDGQNLAQVVREHPLPAARAARYLQIIAEAIQFAHDRGVLHRDLKPSNVLIDPFDQPRITDFGLAKKTTGDSELTQTGQVLGAPSFVPPEQAAGRKDDVGAYSDVYALGAILYYLLTGRPPFAAETPTATLAQVLNTEPAAPRLLNASVPRDLETVCLKCLEKDPQRRYPTARELANELSRFLRGEPILARPVSQVEKAWRWSRRNPPLTGLGVALVLVFASGFTGVLWQWQRADRTAKEEARQRQRADVKAQAESKAKAEADEQRQRAERLAEEEARQRRLAEEKAQAEARAVAQAEQQQQRAEKLAEEEGVQRRRAETSAAEEARQRQLAEKLAAEEALQRQRANEALNRMEMQRAEAMFAADDSASALASLAHVLRRDSSNRVAAERLLSALAQRTFALPVGKPLTVPFDTRQGSEPLLPIEFSPDGQKLLLCLRPEDSKAVRVWNAQTGQSLPNSFRHVHPVMLARFTADGEQVITVTDDNTVTFWNVNSGVRLKEIPRSLSPDSHRLSGRLRIAEFSSEGRRCATVCSNLAQVWDVESGRPVTKPLKHSKGTSLDFAQFSPDGQLLATIASTNTWVWDLQNSQLLKGPLISQEAVVTARFSPEGQRLATGSSHGALSLWNVYAGLLLTGPARIDRSDRPVRTIQFSRDGQRFVIASGKTARILDAHTLLRLTEPIQHRADVDAAQYSPNGEGLITVSRGDIQVWDARAGRAFPAWFDRRRSELDGSRDLRVSSNTVQIVDVHTGQAVSEPFKLDAKVRFAELGPGGRHLIAVSESNTVRLWETHTGQLLSEELKLEDGGRVDCVGFSSDGSRVLTVSSMARIWDAQTGQLITRFKVDDQVNSADFSPDGRLLVTATRDHIVRIWDIGTGLPLIEPLKHAESVRSAHFSPDGLRLLTASRGRIQLWDARTGQALTEPFVELAFDATRFSPDGHWIIADKNPEGWTTMEIPVATNSIPGWLPDLAEAVAGKRINEQGIAEFMPPGKLTEFKEQLVKDTGTDLYGQWARWFFADRATRSLSPGSLLTVSKLSYASPWSAVSLQEALQLSPTNALAMALLAVRLSREPDPDQTKHREADWLSRRAAELTPGDPQVSQIRDRFEQWARELARGKRIKSLNRLGLNLVEKIERLFGLIPRPPESDHN